MLDSYRGRNAGWKGLPLTATANETAAASGDALERVIILAAKVINEHANRLGLCAVCGCAFPCARAVLAEHSLAL